MNLHEHQAKELLSSFGVPIQRGMVVENIDQLQSISQEVKKNTGSEWLIVKAQIHAGGRGKGGGVKVAKNDKELYDHANNILGMMLKTPQTPKEGKLVKKILISEDVYYPGDSETQEFYMSILLNRKQSCNMIMYSKEGGVDIEPVSYTHLTLPTKRIV